MLAGVSNGPDAAYRHADVAVSEQPRESVRITASLSQVLDESTPASGVDLALASSYEHSQHSQ